MDSGGQWCRVVGFLFLLAIPEERMLVPSPVEEERSLGY